MALFRYEALEAGGNVVRGTLEAGTPAEARASLREKGRHATKLETAIPTLQPGKTQAAAISTVAWEQLNGRRLELLSAFSRHLAMLLKAGLPLAQALTILTDQLEDNRFREVVQDVASRVREGVALDEALAAHPRYFPVAYVCVARAGAASGELGQLLGELAAYYTRQKRLRDKVVSALAYPALMSAIGLAVVTFLLAFVVPKVTSVLLEQHRALPWPTEVLLAVSGFVHGWWWALLIGVVLGGWILNVLWRMDRARRAFDRLLLSLPVLGDLIRKQAVARWADTMSNLLSSGIPVAQALSVVKGALGNRVLADDVMRIEQAVLEGRDLSEAIKKSVVLPRAIGFVVGVGEETGALARVLREVAEGYNEEVEVVSGRLTEMLNPILIVALGVLVGFIVAAILLPITDFSQLQ
jgi:general secretion pathway protein F